MCIRQGFCSFFYYVTRHEPSSLKVIESTNEDAIKLHLSSVQLSVSFYNQTLSTRGREKRFFLQHSVRKRASTGRNQIPPSSWLLIMWCGRSHQSRREKGQKNTLNKLEVIKSQEEFTQSRISSLFSLAQTSPYPDFVQSMYVDTHWESCGAHIDGKEFYPADIELPLVKYVDNRRCRFLPEMVEY